MYRKGAAVSGGLKVEASGGGMASSVEEQEICFQKSHFKHLWWISMLRQREDNNTERNPIGIFEKSTCLGI